MTRSSRALRRGRWKYLRAADTDALYDLRFHPREQANLAARHPGVRREPVARWEEINTGLLPYPSSRARGASGRRARRGNRGEAAFSS